MFGIDGDFLTFVTTSHNPKVHRRGPLAKQEAHIVCKCGDQTRWRPADRMIAIRSDWLAHVRKEFGHGTAQSA